MKTQIKESKAVSYSLRFKTSHKNSTSHSNLNEINNRSLTEPLRVLNLNSKLVEETTNAIIEYFNNHSVFTLRFVKNFEKEIESLELCSGEEKLDSLPSDYFKASDLNSKFGLKNILYAFAKYNESDSMQKNDPYENIDFIIEPFVEKHNSHLVWVDQTIVDPWYKN